MSSRHSQGFDSGDKTVSRPGSGRDLMPAQSDGNAEWEAAAPDPLVGQDILDTPQAGTRVIQGTAVRSAGYFAGVGLALLSAPLLTRHLGVADYGSYVVVGSLIAIAVIFADAGMTAVGIKEYSVRDASGRTRLLQNLVSARLAASAAAGTGVVLFALAAGYAPILVAGTTLGAVALVLSIAQRTYAIPLAGRLAARIGIRCRPLETGPHGRRNPSAGRRRIRPVGFLRPADSGGASSSWWRRWWS